MDTTESWCLRGKDRCAKLQIGTRSEDQAAAVCRDMVVLEVECPRWDTIRVDKEIRVNFRYVCQEVVSHTLVTCARESDREFGKGTWFGTRQGGFEA